MQVLAERAGNAGERRSGGPVSALWAIRCRWFRLLIFVRKLTLIKSN